MRRTPEGPRAIVRQPGWRRRGHRGPGARTAGPAAGDRRASTRPGRDDAASSRPGSADRAAGPTGGPAGWRPDLNAHHGLGQVRQPLAAGPPADPATATLPAPALRRAA